MRIKVDGREYTFDFQKFLNTELMAVERETGFTAEQFQDKLNDGSMIAITALVWILQKRHDDPTRKFEDVVFDTSTLDTSSDPKETEPELTSPELAVAAIPVEVSTGTESSSSSDTGSDRGSSTV